jgi:CBS domain-containing membrane protein
VTPDTRTLDATALMQKHRIGCLPVVQDGHIVAVLTEEDFVAIATDLLEQQIGEAGDPLSRTPGEP